ncbi:MAG: hypothetical protein GY903_08425 [Fuerstiella sp.]|nr:hypothetical protein [Fuerstiella sp.]MCP4854504.1 hypothetical protein [Fuerstiella sp.]
MNVTRQQLLLGVLMLMGVVRIGDYVLSSMIQGPLRELQGENRELLANITKQEKLLAVGREAGQKIEQWQKKSLPSDTETARSLYRNWLLETVRSAKLRNAAVNSGSPASRRGLYRTMPFTVQARGNLKEITSALFSVEKSNQLHRITTLRLTPVGTTGQFDLSMSVEALIIPGARATSLNKGESTLLSSTNRRDYDVIAHDNIFGIGIDTKDPMKLTILSAVTYRNGEPTVWITEQIDDRVLKLPAGAEFETTAINGRVVTVTEESVVIESGEQLLKMDIGQSFADAVVTSGS